MPYKIARVCLNGHLITNNIDADPVFAEQKCCTICGSEAISYCSHCNAEIRGAYSNGFRIDFEDKTVYAYCHNCGNPYPWTEASLEKAEMIIVKLAGVSKKTKKELSKSFKDLMQETPGTEYAILLAKQALSVCKSTAKEALIGIITELACAAVKTKLGF